MDRRKYTEGFKLEAARLINERGMSHVQAAQDLGAHMSELRVDKQSSPTIRNTPLLGTAR